MPDTAIFAPIPLTLDQQARCALRDAASLVLLVGWTKHAFARGKSGRKVDESGKRACAWCGSGALIRVIATCGTAEVHVRALVAFCRTFPAESIITFNDRPGRTREHVAAALCRAADAIGRGEA